MPGIMYLYSKQGEMVRYTIYLNASNRKIKLDNWRKMIGDTVFNRLILQIVPETNDACINRRGENTIRPQYYKKQGCSLDY